MREWTFHVDIWESNMSFGLCIFLIPIDTTPARRMRATKIHVHNIHTLTHSHSHSVHMAKSEKLFVSNCVIALNYPLEEFACRRIAQWFGWTAAVIMLFQQKTTHTHPCVCIKCMQNIKLKHAKRIFVLFQPQNKCRCTWMKGESQLECVFNYLLYCVS